MRRLVYTLPNGETTCSYKEAVAQKVADTFRLEEIEHHADSEKMRLKRVAHFKSIHE